MSATRQHGVSGAYVGGDWVNIEDCAEHFNVEGASGGSCGGECSVCPRSRSRHNSSKSDGSYDVVVIGAGCVGAAVARELSKSTASVLLLEAADDVTQGATKGNSGIVHAGYDDKPGSRRAEFCWKGNQMFPQLDRELHFGYQKNGSLVVAFSEEEVVHLNELLERGKKNGVKRLRIVRKEELFEMEPHINPTAVAALYSPDAGNLIPYEYAIALAENAVDNGVELRIRREVTDIVRNSDGSFVVQADYWEPTKYVDEILSPLESSSAQLSNYFLKFAVVGGLVAASLKLYSHRIDGVTGNADLVEKLITGLLTMSIVSLSVYAISVAKNGSTSTGRKNLFTPLSVGSGGRAVTVDEMRVGGSGSRSVNDGVTVARESFKTKYVVNCAGAAADRISGLIGDDSFKIKTRLGDYIILNREQGKFARHTIFPCPDPVLGKGVLVQTTLWGMLILGPTARDTHIPEVMAQTLEEVQRYILHQCRKLVPSFDPKETITSFCGARAKSTRGDWIIEPSSVAPNFIQAAGIDSPGLAGSPAIAMEVVKLLREAGLELKPNLKFNPIRAPVVVPKSGWKGIKAGPVGKYTNPVENVVCKCEKVTEAEIVDALHRSLPIDSTQAIRKRTRAGMGHCQGDAENYNCECRVADIIARETSVPVEVVGRRPWPATASMSDRWLNDKQRERLDALSL